MAATTIDLTCHIIFATKHRQPWIADPWKARLDAYMGGIQREKRVLPIAIGGTSDRVHLLVGLRGTHAVADVVKDVKTASTGWIKETHSLPPFGRLGSKEYGRRVHRQPRGAPPQMLV